MNNMITVELNADEKAALLQLLDGAVKFYGLQSSKAVAYFIDKLAAAETPNKEDTLNG